MIKKFEPDSADNRSPLYRLHQQNSAVFMETSNSASIVSHYFNLADEKAQCRELALVDLTPLNRIGFKGADTPTWLEKQKINLPNQPNRAVLLKDNSLVAQLSYNEFLILSSLRDDSKVFQKLYKWKLKKNLLCYQLNRQHSHSWFALTGSHCKDTLAKLCGVDMANESFPIHQVAQTSVARVNSILIRDTINGIPLYHLLSDSTSSEYIWNCLLDAMSEFSGKAVGLQALSSS